MIKATLPGQVAFQLPQATFEINMNHLVPDNNVNIRIRVRNTSDRAIQVMDAKFDGGTNIQQGFTLTPQSLTVAAGAEGWFVYDLVVGDVDELNDALVWLADHPNGLNYVYNSNTNVLKVTTALNATGIFPTGTTNANFNFTAP